MGAARVAKMAARANSSDFVNCIAFAVIFPIAMLVMLHAAQLAHKLSKRQLEMGLALFLLFVSARFRWSMVA
jgi:uncharacterized membrane protein YfcA